ncbi:MAG: NAD(P)-dependent dehydrogenase (short-subunit alcohol dehydrogenase family) [Algoriphagus sp.]|jgi:NAD(P)-dependent dehydrogenase (short-subunit alcohol dehydrogenase family)
MKAEKIIIVTGGSGLIGKAIVQDLQAKRALVINFDVQKSSDLNCEFLQCDITNPESVREAISSVLDRYGRIDGLVNNAYPRTKDWGTPFDELSVESWQKNVDLQMNSVFYITQQVLLQMKKQKSGSIVNMTSIYGVIGNDQTIYEGTKIKTAAPYSAIKGGLINFTRYLAGLYGQNNVRINCVSPGGIFDSQDPKFVAAYEHKVPMKRMGYPEDIAPAISFLLSDEAGYITGQNLIVDGGWTAI